MQIKEKNDSRSDIFCKSCEATRVVTVCNQIHLVEKRRFLHFHSNKKYFPFNRGRNCENGGGGARDPNRGLMTGNTAEIYICTILWLAQPVFYLTALQWLIDWYKSSFWKLDNRAYYPGGGWIPTVTVLIEGREGASHSVPLNHFQITRQKQILN